LDQAVFVRAPVIRGARMNAVITGLRRGAQRSARAADAFAAIQFEIARWSNRRLPPRDRVS